MWMGGMWVTILNMVVRVGPIEKVTCEQKLEEDKTAILISGERIYQTRFISYVLLQINPGLLDGSVIKNLPAKQEMRVQFMGQKDPLEEEIATYSLFLLG